MADEVRGTVEVCVVLRGMLETEITVNLFTVDMSAIGILVHDSRLTHIQNS